LTAVKKNNHPDHGIWLDILTIAKSKRKRWGPDVSCSSSKSEMRYFEGFYNVCLVYQSNDFLLYLFQPTTPVVEDEGTMKKGLLWQQRDKLFSRWKERYFILTKDYFHCFKKGSSRITEMGGFIFKVRCFYWLIISERLCEFRKKFRPSFVSQQCKISRFSPDYTPVSFVDLSIKIISDFFAAQTDGS
jgi:hypothetical protein